MNTVTPISPTNPVSPAFDNAPRVSLNEQVIGHMSGVGGRNTRRTVMEPPGRPTTHYSRVHTDRTDEISGADDTAPTPALEPPTARCSTASEWYARCMDKWPWCVGLLIAVLVAGMCFTNFK